MTPDTVKIVTDTVNHSVKYQILTSLQPMGWVVIWLGWILFWLKNLAILRKETAAFGKTNIKDFLSQNIFEIPVSFFSVLTIAIMAPSIPPSVIDMQGIVSIFIVGYSGGSMITGLMALRKTPQTTQEKSSPKTATNNG